MIRLSMVRSQLVKRFVNPLLLAIRYRYNP